MFFNAQTRYIVSCLEGTIKLPPFQEMEAILSADEEERKKQGYHYSEYFQLGPFGTEAWKYYFDMAKEDGFSESLKQWPLLEHSWNTLLSRILGKLALFRGDELKIIDENTWEYVFHSSPEYPESKGEKMTMRITEDGSFVTEKVEL